MTSASAKERPVYMVESGPAAGAIAAGVVAAPYRYANVVSFDMGGTTAQVGLIQDGPAIIEEPDASTLVHPGWTATVDEHANLVLRPAPR